MSLLDFSNIGDISMFVNESSLGFLENVMNKKGYLDGRILSMAFNALRPNDLIWPYFINNYLLNKPLQAFDILYWNSDPTNLPANMYKFYLRDICYKNLLCKPNAIEIKGVGIDLSKVTVPMFSVAGEKDHITPWKSVYSSARLYGGSSQFILSSSGHVKGLINPPKDNKYSYKISVFNKKLPKNPAVWLDRSIEYPGSWWNYWKNWLISINSEKIKSKECAALNINSLRDAPGNYVLKRL
jgi:polyhydroxyalkanoate synthase